METLLSLRGVTRSVVLPDDQELHILRGIDLEVFSGDHTAFVGRSGCGKSTLLKLLGLLDVPCSGELEFLGLDGAEVGLWLVEWPERGAGHLPAPDLTVHLAMEGSGRLARLESGSEVGAAWVDRLTATHGVAADS